MGNYWDDNYWRRHLAKPERMDIFAEDDSLASTVAITSLRKEIRSRIFVSIEPGGSIMGTQACKITV